MLETKNERTKGVTKTQTNKYDNKRDVKVYKHRHFEIVEVDKEKIEKIKTVVDDARGNINKGAVCKDVVLGLSTTLFGGFIGCVPDIIKMITSNTLTMIIFFYFALF